MEDRGSLSLASNENVYVAKNNGAKNDVGSVSAHSN